MLICNKIISLLHALMIYHVVIMDVHTMVM